MSTDVPSFKAFDPTVAAATGVQRSGGGNVTTGTPTLYSRHSAIPHGHSYTAVIVTTSSSGPFAGALTIEVSNSSDSDDAMGVAKWSTYDNLSVAIPAVSGAMNFNIELVALGFNRVRLKFVTSAGVGTILAEVCIKG